MGKRNKIRYQSKPKPAVEIALTGRVHLQFQDEEALAQAQKGDLMLYAKYETPAAYEEETYYGVGKAGYFKVDVHDGKNWQPVLLNDIFPSREHHFSKKERPIDCYEICRGLLEKLQGKPLLRTYREHFTLAAAGE